MTETTRSLSARRYDPSISLNTYLPPATPYPSETRLAPRMDPGEKVRPDQREEDVGPEPVATVTVRRVLHSRPGLPSHSRGRALSPTLLWSRDPNLTSRPEGRGTDDGVPVGVTGTLDLRTPEVPPPYHHGTRHPGLSGPLWSRPSSTIPPSRTPGPHVPGPTGSRRSKRVGSLLASTFAPCTDDPPSPQRHRRVGETSGGPNRSTGPPPSLRSDRAGYQGSRRRNRTLVGGAYTAPDPLPPVRSLGVPTPHNPRRPDDPAETQGQGCRTSFPSRRRARWRTCSCWTGRVGG